MPYKSCAKCHHAAERYGLCLTHYQQRVAAENERAREIIAANASIHEGRTDRGDWVLVANLIKSLDDRIAFISKHSQRNEETIVALRKDYADLKMEIEHTGGNLDHMDIDL